MLLAVVESSDSSTTLEKNKNDSPGFKDRTLTRLGSDEGTSAAALLAG